jgi:hypothetical protein
LERIYYRKTPLKARKKTAGVFRLSFFLNTIVKQAEADNRPKSEKPLTPENTGVNSARILTLPRRAHALPDG